MAADGGSRRPDLPWRSTRDPWAVLVSEVMAQQTQVARVVPVYRPFLERFPTPDACAAAPLGAVIRAWQGLGYNRRAANLHRMASVMVADHGGRVPHDLGALMSLPGVGPYTARAVLAFAFEVDVGVVDTNAGRVLSRAVAGRPVRSGEAQDLVDAMVPAGGGWEFGQALLDLGAVICVAGAPRCPECPIRRRCRWAARGRHLPDPASGSAGVSTPQGIFDGSDRQGRGRLIDALRRGAVRADRVAVAAGWPDDPERAGRVAAGLVDEGLVARDGDGTLRLP
ncbi:MAG: A/G-specific adenine glycosylase [Acidimicrobiales bacterium]|jgi:A/G-specific adenine glycosylase